MAKDQIGFLVGVVVLCILFVSISRRRENFLHNLRSMVVSGVVGFGVYFWLGGVGWEPPEAFVAGLFAAVITDRVLPGRSRYIPRRERRKAIADHEAETGERFNRRIHELDHQIPFSKGGSNTADNLRVVRRRENRAKGARSSWWDILGR